MIKVDRQAINELAGKKRWSHPERGFLNLDKRLVKAVTGYELKPRVE